MYMGRCMLYGRLASSSQKPSASSRLARNCSAVCAAVLFPKRLWREVPRRVESVFASEFSMQSCFLSRFMAFLDHLLLSFLFMLGHELGNLWKS